jgi:single-strand DNA-binding protein
LLVTILQISFWQENSTSGQNSFSQFCDKLPTSTLVLIINVMNLNVVNLVGRVGGDPDVKFFESGAVKCTLTLAVNRRTRNSDQPDWFNLELWDKTAKVAADYVRKGSLIGVQGSLKIETWSDRTTGTNRSKPVIRVDRLELLGSKRDNDSSMADSYNDTEF